MIKKTGLSWLMGTLATFSGMAAAQTITIATHYPPENVAVMEPCFEAYRDLTGVTVEPQQIPYGDYLSTILTARLGGQAPDIYHVYSIWAAQLIDNGVLATPPEETLSFIGDNYIESTVGAVTIDDQVWGIPTEVSNYLLVYNKKLLAEAGYDAPPTTWDELLDMAKATTKKDGQGRVTQAGFAFGDTMATTVHPFLTLLYSKGVNPFTDDFTGTNLTSPEAVATLKEEMALFEEGVASPSVVLDDFQSGEVALTIQPVWIEGGYREVFGDAFEETVGISQIPAGPDWRSLQYAFFYAVDASSDVSDEAWAFLQWLNSQESALAAGGPSCMGQMLIDLGALTANNADIAASQEALGDFFTKPFADALERSVSEPNVIQAAEIEAVLQTYIEQAWRGQLSAEDALAQADEEITAILSEFY